jgi:hypothetical protein
MKFTLSEWASIKCALGTALSEEEDYAANLEKEVKSDTSLIKDYLQSKIKIAELAGFIQRIESATI